MVFISSVIGVFLLYLHKRRKWWSQTPHFTTWMKSVLPTIRTYSFFCRGCYCLVLIYPDRKIHGANIMGPTWVLSAPDGPHVGPMNVAIRVFYTDTLLGCCIGIGAITWHDSSHDKTPRYRISIEKYKHSFVTMIRHRDLYSGISRRSG